VKSGVVGHPLGQLPDRTALHLDALRAGAAGQVGQDVEIVPADMGSEFAAAARLDPAIATAVADW
jgi:hypothetical protein